MDPAIIAQLLALLEVLQPKARPNRRPGVAFGPEGPMGSYGRIGDLVAPARFGPEAPVARYGRVGDPMIFWMTPMEFRTKAGPNNVWPPPIYGDPDYDPQAPYLLTGPGYDLSWWQ